LTRLNFIRSAARRVQGWLGGLDEIETVSLPPPLNLGTALMFGATPPMASEPIGFGSQISNLPSRVSSSKSQSSCSDGVDDSTDGVEDVPLEDVPPFGRMVTAVRRLLELNSPLSARKVIIRAEGMLGLEPIDTAATTAPLKERCERVWRILRARDEELCPGTASGLEHRFVLQATRDRRDSAESKGVSGLVRGIRQALDLDASISPRAVMVKALHVLTTPAPIRLEDQEPDTVLAALRLAAGSEHATAIIMAVASKASELQKSEGTENASQSGAPAKACDAEPESDRSTSTCDAPSSHQAKPGMIEIQYNLRGYNGLFGVETNDPRALGSESQRRDWLATVHRDFSRGEKCDPEELAIQICGTAICIRGRRASSCQETPPKPLAETQDIAVEWEHKHPTGRTERGEMCVSTNDPKVTQSATQLEWLKNVRVRFCRQHGYQEDAVALRLFSDKSVAIGPGFSGGASSNATREAANESQRMQPADCPELIPVQQVPCDADFKSMAAEIRAHFSVDPSIGTKGMLHTTAPKLGVTCSPSLYETATAIVAALRANLKQRESSGLGAMMKDLRTQLAIESSDDAKVLETACRELGIEFQPSAGHFELAKQLTTLLNGSAA
jgi:hypothetical protein